MAVIVAVFIPQVPRITLDFSTEGFLHKKDPSLLMYNAFRDQFGRDEVVIIAIHFMHNFRRYYEEKGDPVWAVQETLHTTGRAMLVTTVVLSIGFFIFMFADMKNIFNFGFLTGITIIMALLSDYFLAPALMVLANKAVSDKL